MDEPICTPYKEYQAANYLDDVEKHTFFIVLSGRARE